MSHSPSSYKSALFTLLYCVTASSQLTASTLNLPDIPLSVASTKTALVQLVVQRDNNLFYEAYPSYEDIDGDGVFDISFKPEDIDYYGYFDSDLCYTHDGSTFKASAYALDKKCLANDSSWSGDFLNYLTMTRMDILLAALYGGKRHIDTDTRTVLRRAFVPWDAHTWGIEYNSASEDGYSISDYSSLAEPTSGSRHLLASTNAVTYNDIPYLRIRKNQTDIITAWVDKERTQGDGSSDENLIVDIEVCSPDFLESYCQQYPDGNYKPTGLLHEYGENNSMYFSLLTGSYENNIQGGVLRKTMSSFADEFDSSNGVFTSTDGIVHSLDSIQIPNDFPAPNILYDDCSFRRREFLNGECKSWGNPIAEMMYEGMRYLAGEQTPTPVFFDDAAASSSLDSSLGLPAPSWDNPYDANQPYGQCSQAYQLVISDASPSYDSDQLPGSHFSSFTNSSLGSLNVGTIADVISGEESNVAGLKFIGEADGISDRSSTAKTVTTLKTARGHTPSGPHRKGSFYASSIAYFGHQTDLQTSVEGDQTVGNFSLALGSSLPVIEIDVGDNQVTFSPVGVTVGRNSQGAQSFAETNSIVGFYMEDYSPTKGRFRISFEAAEQGGDNDMDALVRYEYEVIDNELELTVRSLSAAAGSIQHIGYSISGTTTDGVYLVIRDHDTPFSRDVDYELDVPQGDIAGSADWNDGETLPRVSTKQFTPTSTPAARSLESPLWYAAKWGGFDDTNDDGLPQTAEWDKNSDGDPDNFFRVTNPGLMVDTLSNVFNSISAESGAIASASISGSSLTADSRVFESSFTTDGWYSELSSRAIDTDGTLADTVDWNVNVQLTEQILDDERIILTYKPSNNTGIAFRWPADELSPESTELDFAQIEALSTDPSFGTVDNKGSDRLDHLRGSDISGFRERTQPLGDIINSAAQVVGPPNGFYPDNWGTDEPESSEHYSDFVTDNATRQRVVYVGANDGMLHAFNAGEYTTTGTTTDDDGNSVDVYGYDIGDGSEIFAYIPAKVFDTLPELTDPDYSHKFYVDASPNTADVFFGGHWRTVLVGGLGKGGQGIYALDITEVGAVTEENANTTVLWEFTDEDDAHLGYSYTSPLITRMHNGRWMAVFASGYNATESDNNIAPDSKAALFFVDIETGDLEAKLFAVDSSNTTPNGINSPTAIDLDNDNIVDIIYAADLHGNLMKFDVSSNNPDNWSRIGNQFFYTVDRTNTTLSSNTEPVTTQLTVGRHPTGEGVLVYLGTGAYLEPTDLENDGSLHKLYAVWDKEPFTASNLRDQFPNSFLEQQITAEKSVSFDADGDGINDTSFLVRESTQHDIDWDQHLGWYMDLEYIDSTGERVVVDPILRENRIIFNTFIPIGDECVPSESGWLMVLDAETGAMPATSLDLDGDGNFSSSETIAGVSSIANPLSAPALAAGNIEDVLLTSNSDGSGTSSALLDSTKLGRSSWREIKP